MRLMVSLLCLGLLAGCSALAGAAWDIFAKAATIMPGPIPPGPADHWQHGLALVGKAAIVLIWLAATIAILALALRRLPDACAAKTSGPKSVKGGQTPAGAERGVRPARISPAQEARLDPV